MIQKNDRDTKGGGVDAQKYSTSKNDRITSDLAPYIAYLSGKYVVFFEPSRIMMVDKESEFNKILEKLRKEGKKVELYKTIEWLDETLEEKVIKETKKDYLFSFRIKYPNWVKLVLKAGEEPVATYLRKRIIEEDLRYLKTYTTKEEHVLKIITSLKDALSRRSRDLRNITLSSDNYFGDYLKEMTKNEEDYERKLEYLMSFVRYAVKRGMMEQGLHEEYAEEILEMIPIDAPYLSELALKQSERNLTLQVQIVVLPAEEVDEKIYRTYGSMQKLLSLFSSGVERGSIVDVFGDLTKPLFSFDIPLILKDGVIHIKGGEFGKLLEKDFIKKYILEEYIKRFDLKKLMGMAEKFEKIPINDYSRLKKVTNAVLITDGAKIASEVISQILVSVLSEAFATGNSRVFSVRIPVAAERILRLATGMKIKEFVEKKIIGGD